MSHDDEVTVLVATQKLSAEDYAEKRAARAEHCLWQLLAAAKQQTDPAVWLNLGLLEAEAFLEALTTGTQHPLFSVHQKRAQQRGAGHPLPSANELHARRLVVLGCIALRRAGLGKSAARHRMAEEIKRTRLLSLPSASALEHWEQRMSALNPADEALLARCLFRCGMNLELITNYFVGMAHVVANLVVAQNLPLEIR
jgi:hypothetical protein